MNETSSPPGIARFRPLPLERFYARWEFRVRHNLSPSDPKPVALRDLLELMDPEVEEAWESMTLGYVDAAGHPLLRAAIAARYQSVGPDQVFVTTGAQEAIYLSMGALLEAGHHVVLVSPAYELLHEAARVASANVTLVPLDSERRWNLDVPQLLDAFRRNTSLLVLNFPHNPTGALPSTASLTTLLDECRDRGVRILSDEVFRGLEKDEAARWPAAVDIDSRAISLGDLSKSYGLAGLRVGWVACRDSSFLQRVAILKDYVSICGAGPSQILAVAALRATERLHSRARSIVSANVAAASNFFAHHADKIEWISPEAGTTAFPRLLSGDADMFCERLAEEDGVLLAPGSLFGFPGGHFRLGLGQEDFADAVSSDRTWLSGIPLRESRFCIGWERATHSASSPEADDEVAEPTRS